LRNGIALMMRRYMATARGLSNEVCRGGRACELSQLDII
jgi:hypothetical protein